MLRHVQEKLNSSTFYGCEGGPDSLILLPWRRERIRSATCTSGGKRDGGRFLQLRQTALVHHILIFKGRSVPQPPYTDPQGAVLPALPHPPSGPPDRAALRDDALRRAPGRPVLMLRPAPVRVRSGIGIAIAYTVTHILVEVDDDTGYQILWEPSWLVRRMPAGR